MEKTIVNTNRRFVGIKESTIFGVANGGQVMSFTLITSYLTYFYVNIFNVDPKIVATLLFLEGIWDTFNDPLMGSIVDKTRTRWGKLRPFLLGVPAPMATATVLFFAAPLLIHNPDTKALSKILYMAISYTIWEFLYTISDVPFWGMAAAISPNPADRTRTITSARLISGILGAIPTILMPILIDLTQGGVIQAELKRTFFVCGSFFGILGMGLFFLSGVYARERVPQSMDAPKLRECFKCITHNPPLRLIIWQNALGALGSIGGIFGNYYFIDVLGSASASLLVGVPGAIVSLLSFSFIGKVKKRFNNKQIVIANKFFNDLLGILVFFLSIKKYSNISFMLPLITIQYTFNALFAGLNAVVPTEMVADTVDYMEWTTGQRSEGMSFSVLTLIGKLNGAISRSLGALMLSVIGYRTSHTNAIIPQTEAVKFRIFAMHKIVPILLGMFSIIPIFFYDLVGEKQQRMLRELAERREALAKEAEVVL